MEISCLLSLLHTISAQDQIGSKDSIKAVIWFTYVFPWVMMVRADSGHWSVREAGESEWALGGEGFAVALASSQSHKDKNTNVP